MKKVQNYHCHEHMSNLGTPDSVATREDYAIRAKHLGHSILSSCAHGNQGDYWLTYLLAKKYDLQWRYVTEAYFVHDRLEKDKTNAHMILAAKTHKGVGDLNMVLSEANISGYYHHPRIDWQLLLSLDPRDVFVTTACIGGLFKYGEIKEQNADGKMAWTGYDFRDTEKYILKIAQHFGESFMLEVQSHDTLKQKQVNEFLLNMHKKHGLPLIAGIDSHYINPEDSDLRKYRLEANHIFYEDEQGWYMDYPDDKELVRRFKSQGVLSSAQIESAIDNTNVFLDFEDIELDRSVKLPTIYPDLTQDERNQKYVDTVYQEWETFSKGMTDEEKQIRLKEIEYETSVVTEANMSDYFLLDYAIVKEAKKNGGIITPTGRGSGVSYLTNSILGFSSVDRCSIPVQMFPDRFISKERLLAGNLPDLDLNLANEEVFEAAQKKVLGEWSAAPMCAFGTLKRLSAWRMLIRAKNNLAETEISQEIVDHVADQLKEYEAAVRNAEEADKKAISPYDFVEKDYHDLLRQSDKYANLITSISTHPCAHLIGNFDIRREIGIIRINSTGGKKKTSFAAFITGERAEQFGYLKNDLLHVDVAMVNYEAYERAGIPFPTVNELLKLTENDAATWKLYEDGLTLGLNQVEQTGTTLKVQQYKPKNITELSAFVAAVRPSFKSMVNEFLARNKFQYNIPALDKLIQTEQMQSSFILYQEQIMSLLQYAGFTPSDSYVKIKSIAKKKEEEVYAIQTRFKEGFIKRLIEEEHETNASATDTADRVWTIISDAARYLFNACLSGNERLHRLTKRKNIYHPTIEEMYRIKNDKEYAIQTGHFKLHEKYNRTGYGRVLSLLPSGRLMKNYIVDIRFSGVEKTYLVTTESGKSITCTSKHKFPTPQGEKMLKDLQKGDVLYASKEFARRTKNQPFSNGYVAVKEKILYIVELDQENVYDIEVKGPAHNFVTASGIITCNSHATCTALDSLYGAYIKAHHPMEYYTTLLMNYSKNSKKDKISLAREEMARGFGIKMVPCKFRQDNRSYYIDKENKSISDALTSVKFMNKAVAEDLYNMRDIHFDSFVDILWHIETNCSLNKKHIETLIRMGYFRELGQKGTLLEIYSEFKEGKNRLSSKLKDSTIEQRKEKLYLLEESLLLNPPLDPTLAEEIEFEIAFYGAPISTFKNAKGLYAVLEIDTKYSPKLKLYNMFSGTTGVMKMLKPVFNIRPIEQGNVIRIDNWSRKQARKFVDGKSMVRHGVYDLWIDEYSIVT